MPTAMLLVAASEESRAQLRLYGEKHLLSVSDGFP